MADSNFRASRSRDPIARDDVDPIGNSDPLAELARLIGQGDRTNEFERDPRQDSRQGAVATLEQPAGDRDWAADDGYAEQDQYAEDGYAQPQHPQPQPDDRGYGRYERDEERAPPPPAARYSEPAPTYDDPRYADDDRYQEREQDREPQRSQERAPDTRYRDNPPRSGGRQLPSLAPQSYDDEEYESDEHWDDGRDAHADGAEDQYDDETSGGTRRSGLVIVLAMLGLVFVGATGAFAYRAMFGGAILAPSLPPVIKANNGPNKIVPNRSDTQAAANPGGTANAASPEKLVSREEQPVAIQPPNAPPRVVSTIPVPPASSGPQQAGVPVSLPAPGVVAPAPPAAAPAPSAPPPKAAAPAAGSTEPKKIHTVTIRSDQVGNAAAPAPTSAPTPLVPPPAARSHERDAPPARQQSAAPAPRAGGANAPLALVPTAQGPAQSPAPVAEPTRTRVARAEPAGAPAPLATAPAAPAAAAAGGGYAVQVTSQRSEAEAQSAFKALQAKFPGQLGSHQPLIHRADLGDKGTYYRAMVGPFASAEAAASLCSSLKAAGGSCIVQRN
jgi:cell division septation protein DedD